MFPQAARAFARSIAAGAGAARGTRRFPLLVERLRADIAATILEGAQQAAPTHA
jgi:hypothetical protein